MSDCIFCKLINKTIPTQVVYEDEQIFVFNDISPKADVHLLLIPKRHISSMLELQTNDHDLMGHLLVSANRLACEHGLQKGYKVQINTGIKGGQEVFHLHLHVLGNK